LKGVIILTGNDIFNTALDLCALRNTNGSIPADCEDLKQRAVGLLNLLIAENAYLDSLIKKQKIVISIITSLSDKIELSPLLTSVVLPYGLAFLLIQNEDSSTASFFRAKYESEKNRIQSQLKGVIQGITEVY
jgi:hypothetical protein